MSGVLSPISMPSPAPVGIQEALGAEGYTALPWNGKWVGDNVQAINAFIASYDELPAVKKQAIATVEQSLQDKINAGLSYTWTDSSGTQQKSVIALDEMMQGKVNRMVAIASNTLNPPSGITMPIWPSSTMWATQSGPLLPVATPGAMLQLGAAVGHYVMGLDQYAQYLALQIEGASSASDVATILSGASWPTN
jgi:hypothetical protein